MHTNQNSIASPIEKVPRNEVFPKGLQIVMTALACLIGIALITSFVNPHPIVYGGFIFSRVTCSLGFLVTVVGAVVAQYTKRYLDGDPKLASFTWFLGISVSSALCMILADNLVLLVVGWGITSIGLHFLLTHIKNDEDASTVARKKFIISRLGDIALLLGLESIYRSWGTLSLTHLFEQIRMSHQTVEAPVWWICIAAISKSAQFPFHTWLPDTLASPTPVSALMHAGIINGGGALLLKFSPAIVEVPTAGLFLTLIGSATMTIGMVSLWGQTSIKRKLAWSTVSQMGFMTAECGISAFVAAFIHVLGHGFYKANAFLDSGTLEPMSPQPTHLTKGPMLALILAGLMLSLPLQLGIHTGQIRPTDYAVIVMTGLAGGHLFAALYAHLSTRLSRYRMWATMIGCCQLIALISAFTFRLATQTLYLPLPHPSQMATITCTIPVVTIFGLTLYRAFESDLKASNLGKALHIHSQSGFYVGLLADKLVSKIWNPSLTKN